MSGRILLGKWLSPYDGRTWINPSDVDIDHVIPLKEAWESGARTWSANARMRFANDLDFAWSLDAMTDNLNSAKRERDPTGWLPPKAKCRYVTHWVAVKYRWRLSIDAKEKVKAASILTGRCGAKRLTVPTRASLTVATPPVTATPAPTSTAPTATASPPPTITATATPTVSATSTPTPTAAGATDPRFNWCYQANAAGYGPYYRGIDPEYQWYNDRDKDGIVCER